MALLHNEFCYRILLLPNCSLITSVDLLNSLPKDKIFDVTKLKAFADEKIIIAQMMISVFDRVENIVEKGENAGNQHFLSFPIMFSKVGIVW